MKTVHYKSKDPRSSMSLKQKNILKKKEGRVKENQNETEKEKKKTTTVIEQNLKSNQGRKIDYLERNKGEDGGKF